VWPDEGLCRALFLFKLLACTDKSTGASNKHRYCTHLFKNVFYSEAQHSYASLDFQQQTVLSSTLSPNHAKGQKGAQRTNKTKKLNQRKILGGLTSAHSVLLKHSYFQKDTDGLPCFSSLLGFISSLPQLAWNKRLCCCCCCRLMAYVSLSWTFIIRCWP
jgi:hypothetical protein